MSLTVDRCADAAKDRHPEDRREDARAEPSWPSSWLVPPGAVVEWARLQEVLVHVTPPCRVDPEAWFTSRRRPVDFEAHRAAVEACGRCPVVEPCRAYAVAARERDGVWGGLTAVDRRAR